MSWNFRVVAFKQGSDRWLAIHEVHYDESGRPNGYSGPPAAVHGDTPADLAWCVERMAEALKKPALAEEDFPT